MQDTPSTRTGRCVTCRLRKVKCSGGTAPCHNCHRLKLNCSFTGSSRDDGVGLALVSPTGQRTEAGYARRRISAACGACRAKKTKCDGQRPLCSRCRRQRFACNYVDDTVGRRLDQGRTSTWNEHQLRGTSAPTPPMSSETAAEMVHPDLGASTSDTASLNIQAERRFLSRDVLAQHTEAYFTHIYHLPGYNFFHRPSMLEDLQNDRVAPILSIAICATVSSYLDRSKSGKQLAIQWATEVDGYISTNMNNLNLLNLQVIMLSLYQHFAYRQFGRSWLLLGMATRLALGIQLNKGVQGGASDSSFAARECNKRLAWSIYIHDKLQSGGIEEFVTMPQRWINLSLPLNDDDFHRERDCATSTLADNLKVSVRSDLNPSSYMVILMTLRHEILRTTKSIIANTTPTQERDMTATLAPLVKLRNDMQAFYTALPPHLVLSDRNVFLHSQNPEFISFISLHTWYFQACCDLYRICLPGFSRESAPSEFFTHAPTELVLQWQRLAVSFALKLALTWEHLLNMKANGTLAFPGKVAPLDPANCISVYQCTKILLVARNHCLFEGLVDPVSHQPLCLEEEAVFRLGRSNLDFLGDLASIVPIAAVVQRDVKNMLSAEATSGSEQVPVTSQVQREHVLSRYNVLAMGIAASNANPESSHRTPAYHTQNIVSGASCGNTGRQKDLNANVSQHHLATSSQGYMGNMRSMSYPQQIPPQQHGYVNLTEPQAGNASHQNPGHWDASAVPELGNFIPPDMLHDYAIAGSQFNMGGELDWFLMNSLGEVPQ